MRPSFFITAASLSLALGVPLSMTAQEAANGGQFVTKEEFNKLKAENDALKQEVQSFREFKARFEQANKTVAPPEGAGLAAGTNAPDTKDFARYLAPGSTRMLLTGYGSAGYSDLRHNDPSFSAQFNPMLLWKINDRLLFEGELEFELEDGETSAALEVANLSYLVNDLLTFQAGKFLNPMNSFVERYHMAWVNRLPDKPLAVYDGLLPETYVGAQLRGGAPLGPTKVNYSAFVANAPKLITSVGPDDDLASLGTMEFDNFGNSGGRIAVGGHVGFQPLPEVEIGYGLHWSGLSDSDEKAFLQSADFSYLRDSETLRGTVRVNAQWVWSQLGRGVYDNDGTPLIFRNNRDGGYVLLAYRPTHAPWDVLRPLEGVFRYDVFNQKNTPVGFDECRYTIGLNYWLTPKTVFKSAYQFDHRSSHEPSQNGVLLEFATGL